MDPINVFLLILFFGSLFAVWYMVVTKRGIGAWLVKHQANREIRIVEQCGISPRNSILLVEVRGQSYLVAQSPNGVQMIRVEDKPAKSS